LLNDGTRGLAREALTRSNAGEQPVLPDASLDPGARRCTDGVHRPGGSPSIRADLGGQRPRGFTRAVQEFHQMILGVRIEDLSAADRSTLRSLFRDLVMLARATGDKRQPVFPTLPPTSIQLTCQSTRSVGAARR
jgi:hypothetical protein